MKKIVALALCLVMVLGLMSGCEKAMDLDTLVQKMDEAAKTVTAQGMTAQMEMDLEMSVTGMTMTMGMDLEMDMKTKTDLSAMYAEMKMAVEAMGESEETNMEIYGVMEDGELISYAYESTTDTWVRTQQEGYGEMLEQLRGMQQSMSSQPKELMSLAEEKATVNDRACYVLTLEMSGEHFQTYMSDYMGTMMSQLTGTEELLDQEAMDMMDQMDWSALSAKMVNYVDAETFLPLESTMEIMGMGETISGLFAEMMQLVEGEDRS